MSSTSSALTMKAAVATGFGAIDENLRIRTDWPRLSLQDMKEKERSSHLLIKVLACALAPGDVRVLSGKTDYVQLPPTGHPYVIGSDTSGIVVEVPDDETDFAEGDLVVARFDEPQPVGGCAEYRLVKKELTAVAPKSLTPVQSCGLPASAAAARYLAREYLSSRKDPRVLILGGAGGVGTFLCQYCRLYGASYIAATSTQEELLTKKLGVDRAIDYRQENWWEMEEYHQTKFDVVFDLVNGRNWEDGACSGQAIHRTGVYAQMMSGVETELKVHGRWDMLRMGLQMLGRTLHSRLNPRIPSWHVPFALELKPGDLDDLVRDMDEGRIQVILDPVSPFPFTEDGVRAAMALQKSIHAHGKVVIQIADKNPEK